MILVDIWVERGMSEYHHGRMTEAQAFFQKALDAQPNHQMALYMLASVASRQDDQATASCLLEQVTRLYPLFGEAHYSLAVAYLGQGRGKEALDSLRRAVEVRPSLADAHDLLYQLHLRMGRLSEAEDSLRKLIALRPEDPEGYRRLAALYQLQDKPGEAIESLREVVTLRPDDMEARDRLAVALQSSGQHAEAAECLRAILKRHPQDKRIWANLSAIDLALEQIDEAEKSARTATQIDPDFADAHFNLGLALYQNGKIAEAVRHYRRADELTPHRITFNYSLWNTLLLNGDFRQGWEVYDWWMRQGTYNPRTFNRPRWDGQSNPDGTLLIYADHGLGDAMQFVRYVPLAKARYQGRIVLECQASLCGLFRSVAGADVVVAHDPHKQPGYPFDAQIGLMSLPVLFKTTLETVPADVPYLSISPERQTAWRERLGDESALKVGLRWAGNPSHGNDHNRSCALSDFAPLAGIEGVRFFSLQTDARAEDVLAAPDGMTITDLSGDLKDFQETAAILNNLDLLIAVDTSLAHLAGALGVPTWTLLAFVPDWRWMMDREDSPWYPTMRLFRQPERKDWQSVFARVAQELNTLVHRG